MYKKGALLLALLLIIGLFSGCFPEGKVLTQNTPGSDASSDPGAESSASPASRTELSYTEGADRWNEVVAKINGRELTYEELRYQILGVLGSFEYYSGADIAWGSEYDGVTIEEYLLGEIRESIIYFDAVFLGAGELGIELDETELEGIAASIREEIENYGSEEAFNAMLEEQHITREIYEFFIQAPELFFKIFNTLYGEGGLNEPSYDEVYNYYLNNYILTKHIMAAYYDDSGALSEEDINKKRALIEEAYARAVNGEDFDALMEEYNEDVYINGSFMCISHGTISEEYYNIASKLEIGEISVVSDILDSSCFIKRIDYDREYFDSDYDEFREEYSYANYDKLVETWKARVVLEELIPFESLNIQAIYENYLSQQSR
jgi:foldase protein PrsA